MPLTLTDDQTMLQDTARTFMAEEGAIQKQLRKYRDMNCKDGFGHALWRQFGEMGFTGILVDEADGGLGLGHVEAGIVLEEIGRNLTPSPFLITAIGAVEALRGTPHRARWLPGILAGETVAALAIDENAKHRPEAIALQAERAGNGFRLTGAKQFVVQGASADLFIVAASAEEGLTLFAVEKGAAGLDIEGVRLADSSVGARIRFEGVEIDADGVIGDVGGGAEMLGRMLSAVRVGVASEQVGVASGAMTMTVDYLKQRKQFGKLIGEFQALQHRAAHLYAEVEIARAAALKAQQLLDEGSDEAELFVSVAKAKAGSVATLAVQEGVQMHGGIGMTDEYDIGLYMKRDRVLGELFGDTNYHADRVARLRGY
ncbi:acyl-CoA dehydrogenase family protein [Sphingosinicella sp. BN140058]|uniref:acyl-CoA dehydrogenase family protein n=1 Tax=Sphingosinicella sp. BN140058 TaxID=1892855 RepID=UPI00101160E4|nr:acyl-CoA dehydrogenase family protein [Sphingosinicella sp. BN140058]QAY78318.1 acyl-CoA dehydrogenase [Sphingosinicella sp. BN140058]